ncbi:hypothetical protein [Oscillibacter sp.]|uniref:hypothetical protein n=1 Tax=Oscillibacter sp. TaxID=1945593 RepID=UPI0026037A8A|nr:hypothetical protein [Oscillibacter sp.]MDD3346410.1 hypothetical protein [Oscillibacter sp.]
MEALECRGETIFPTIVLMLTAFFSLILLIIACVCGVWEPALSVIFPLSAFFFLQWRRRYRLLLYPDRMEIRTWFSAKVYFYEGLTMELRMHNPTSGHGAGLNAHQPLLCLRRDGKVAATVSRDVLRGQDVGRMVDLLRKLAMERKFLYLPD